MFFPLLSLDISEEASFEWQFIVLNVCQASSLWVEVKLELVTQSPLSVFNIQREGIKASAPCAVLVGTDLDRGLEANK